jgi:hypothetical protein
MSAPESIEKSSATPGLFPLAPSAASKAAMRQTTRRMHFPFAGERNVVATSAAEQHDG